MLRIKNIKTIQKLFMILNKRGQFKKLLKKIFNKKKRIKHQIN